MVEHVTRAARRLPDGCHGQKGVPRFQLMLCCSDGGSLGLKPQLGQGPAEFSRILSFPQRPSGFAQSGAAQLLCTHDTDGCSPVAPPLLQDGRLPPWRCLRLMEERLNRRVAEAPGHEPPTGLSFELRCDASTERTAGIEEEVPPIVRFAEHASPFLSVQPHCSRRPVWQTSTLWDILPAAMDRLRSPVFVARKGDPSPVVKGLGAVTV